jgi:hypothetical protein
MRPRRRVESGLGATGAMLAIVGLVAAGCAGSCARKRVVADGKGAQGAKAEGAKPAKRDRLPRIDVHTHISPQGLERALAVMDQWGIDGMVNLSGMVPGPPRHMLETQLQIARASGGRIAVFTNVNFVRAVRTRPDYGTALAEELSMAKEMGAVGLKIPKGLGLGYPAPDGEHVLPVDDPKLDPLFEEAGKLGMPVAIHTGDPKAFWQPPDEKNERIDELRAHPEWSFYGEPVPSWQELYTQFERRVARHPKTIFHRRALWQRPRGSGQRRPHARQVPQPLHRHGGARARDRPAGRGQDAAVFREVPRSHPVRDGSWRGADAGRYDVRIERSLAPDARRRAPLLRIDLALLRDRGQAIRIADADSGALEDRRPRPVRAGFAQALLRERRPPAQMEAAPRPTKARNPRPIAKQRANKVTKCAVELDDKTALNIIIAFAFRSSSVGRADGC